MEMGDASVVDIGVTTEGNTEGNILKVDGYKHSVNELQMQVDKLEKRVNEVQQFYLSTSEKQLLTLKDQAALKGRDKEKNIPSMKRQQQDASRRDAAAAKRMQELTRQFGTILRQITQHKWAWPFMQPVDVEGLGLHDYYEVIDRPMDFSTIKNQMEANDGTGYKHVREIYADMLLVFNNAMKYNDETSDVHAMAKTLLEKFEEKWLQLLPKILEEVIDRPMDFSTIKNQMEANDGTGYKHVRDIYADMLLVFNNAMKYNDETSDVHAMAKTLLEKFEEKWLQLLPKVLEEDKRREEEKAGAQLKKQLAQEAAHARLAKDLTNELNDANKHLEELKEIMVKKCRKITVKEKRMIGKALAQLCPEDLAKALEIVSKDNPNFQATGDEVDLDITTQSEFTLWRLKFFVKDALDTQGKKSNIGGKNNTKDCHEAVTSTSTTVFKRKREICNALAKTAKRRGKNFGS